MYEVKLLNPKQKEEAFTLGDKIAMLVCNSSRDFDVLLAVVAGLAASLRNNFGYEFQDQLIAYLEQTDD